jgi:hypothetical protein
VHFVRETLCAVSLLEAVYVSRFEKPLNDLLD